MPRKQCRRQHPGRLERREPLWRRRRTAPRRATGGGSFGSTAPVTMPAGAVTMPTGGARPCLLVLALACGLLARGGAALAAQSVVRPVGDIGAAENDEARFRLREEVLEAELWRLRAFGSRIIGQTTYGSSVAVSTRELEDAILVEFQAVRGSIVDSRARGNFWMRRRLSDGAAESFGIRLRREDNAYLTVVAVDGGQRGSMDVHFPGSQEPLYRGVLLPVAFARLLEYSLERLVALTAGRVNWELLLHDGSPPDEERIAELVGDVRLGAAGLLGREDGAVDRDGRFVFIETELEQPAPVGLNCSGFVKWLIDGYYRPLTGHNSSIQELKRPLHAERGNRWSEGFESARDPYFGLDWIRNLARVLAQARGKEAAGGEAYDVRDEELAPYVEDVGYPMDRLELVLFSLWVRYPGTFYLASVNGPYGEDPQLWQHHHTAALLPYLDSDGLFCVVVFERNGDSFETELAAFVSRYADQHVHLVRVDAHGTFAPPE